MPYHPPTVDGYFVAGNPLTGDRPAGSVPSLDFFNALLDLLDNLASAPVTLAAETTLTVYHGVIFANPADGATVLYHLPVYASVPAGERYKVKNIGQGIARLDAADGKTIDNAATLDLAPGDRCELVKDGTNWQTI